MPTLKSGMQGIYREAAATALEAHAVNGGSSKKKNKKKKKGKKKTDINDEAAKLLEQLALEDDGVTDDTAVQGEGEDRMELLTQLFEKLKESNNLSPEEREETAAKALDIVDTLRSSLQYFIDSDSSQAFSRDLVLREANDALRALHLLSKFHRQLPPAPLMPHIEPYNNPSRKPLVGTTAFEKLTVRAGPDVDCAGFLMFADNAATLFADYNRTAQAKEEGRRYSELWPVLASTPEVRRQFEWYASDHGVDDGVGVGVGATKRLDSYFGYKYFLYMPHVQSMESPEFKRFGKIAGETVTEDTPTMCICNMILAGAETREQLDKIHKYILNEAEKSGLRFHTNQCKIGVPLIDFWGFRFSGKEIVRV